MIKFLKWDFGQKVNDEVSFEDAANQYAKENEIKPVKFVQDQFGPQGDGKSLDIGDAWKSQQKNKRR